MPRFSPSDSDFGRTDVPVHRYRSIEDMPRPWRRTDDPGNLRAVAQAMRLHRTLVGARDQRRPGVTRYRSFDELKADSAQAG